jgi:hypothetical protein
MFDITLRRPLVSLAVVAGLLVAAGPAAADPGFGKSELSSHTRPSADGIIAVLIGLNHADASAGIAGDGLQVPDVVAPQADPRASGYTPPIGTDKGSRTLTGTP